jgi:hypothetical protein
MHHGCTYRFKLDDLALTLDQLGLERCTIRRRLLQAYTCVVELVPSHVQLPFELITQGFQCGLGIFQDAQLVRKRYDSIT